MLTLESAGMDFTPGTDPIRRSRAGVGRCSQPSGATGSSTWDGWAESW